MCSFVDFIQAGRIKRKGNAVSHNPLCSRSNVLGTRSRSINITGHIDLTRLTTDLFFYLSFVVAFRQRALTSADLRSLNLVINGV